MGEQETGPQHTTERHHERAADVAEIDETTDSDSYRSETFEGGSDRASGIRGAGQGAEE